jgi:hypothetical protein
MRYLLTYDFMESLRVTNQWLGSTARRCVLSAVWACREPDLPDDRRLGRGDRTQLCPHGRQARLGHLLDPRRGRPRPHRHIETVVERPFGDLIRFHVQGRAPTGARCCWSRRCRATTRRFCARPCVASARLRGLHHRLAQRPRHPGQRRQVRCRGLHALPRGFPARDGPGHPCDRGLPARAAGAGRHRLPGRGRPRRAAAHADADRRADRPRRRRHRRHRFRPPRDHGPA